MSNIIRQTTLQFTDLTGGKTGCTTLGSNKFWKGWVVDHGDGQGDFCCQWGSTGTSGSTNGSKHGISLNAAISLFEKKRGEKLKKGYTEIDVRTDTEELAKQKAVGVVPTAPVAAPAVSQGRMFKPEVSGLLARIYGATSTTIRAGLSAQAGASESNPIGNLSDAQLDRGGAILDEIGKVLDQHFGRETSDNADRTLPLSAGGTPSDRILSLTNEYLSNVPREIPRESRGRQNLHRLVISSYARLEDQRKFLTLLRDAYVSKNIFSAAASASSTGGKETVWYDGLACEIDHLSRTDEGHKFCANVFDNAQSRQNANWWRGGRSRLRLVNVYKLTRNGSAPRFEAYADKIARKPGAVGRIFAWHGTRSANLLGICKSGLLMPENLPRGVHISGKAFGRGIYHAPAWNATKTTVIAGQYKTDGTNGALKSMNYTGHSAAYYGGGDSGTVFMFLQEVALGCGQIARSTLWDQHRPDRWPNNDFIYAAASTVPSLAHDEIITFNEDAQVFRYLCEIAVD